MFCDFVHSKAFCFCFVHVPIINESKIIAKQKNKKSCKKYKIMKTKKRRAAEGGGFLRFLPDLPLKKIIDP